MAYVKGSEQIFPSSQTLALNQQGLTTSAALVQLILPPNELQMARASTSQSGTGPSSENVVCPTVKFDVPHPE
ncbi:hypothetical protein VTN31DRAFT_5993 [Thermomyces dupontii]|uniref:uncharacterized protein n=1 Tax=Talaromyces thermophilus TaxID=28565 RepID=UPI003743AF1E